MVRINLLPHRQIKRAERQRQFNLMLAVTAVAAAVLVFMGQTYINSQIDSQLSRNSRLTEANEKLDKEIAEITTLKEQINSVLERKQVVENLQTDRSQAVVVLDELARQLPEGMLLTSIKQQGKTITLQGVADTNARVATLVRNLSTSAWMESPRLIEIKAVSNSTAKTKQNNFTMTVNLKASQPQEATKPEGLKKEMKLEDFNNIDFNNTGSLPLPVKAVLLGVAFILILAAGYWFLWKPAFEELDQAKATESELRQVFLDKKRQAVNLEIYKQQMIEIEKTFGALLRQLPDKSQMDGLLTDINQAGLARGLEFELFKPGQEVQADFYAEMPISIKVIGSYHNLGLFASDVSRLSRIVTLNNLSITPAGQDAKEGLLAMEAVAKTYRYLDSNEMASKQQAKRP